MNEHIACSIRFYFEYCLMHTAIIYVCIKLKKKNSEDTESNFNFANNV